MTHTIKPNTAASTAAPRPVLADTPLKPTATYSEAYAVLAGIAERLRATGSSANIDRLAADLRAARAAHAVCRERLAAIRAEIDLEVAAVEDEVAAEPRDANA